MAESLIATARELEAAVVPPAASLSPSVVTPGSAAPVEVQNVGLERIIGAEDLLSAAFLKRGAECSKSVCCIRQGPNRIGTGFLVCPGILMTNAHVIALAQDAAACSAEFNYEDKLIGGGTEESVVFELQPQRLFFSSPVNKLDYTLVAVATTSGNKHIHDFGFLAHGSDLGQSAGAVNR